MKTASFLKDNITNATLLGVTFFALIGAALASNQAHAVYAPQLELQVMEAITVTAPRLTPLVKMDAIIVTASRHTQDAAPTMLAMR